MRINLLIICMMLVSGCSSHMEDVKKKQELTEKSNLTDDLKIKSEIMRSMKRRSNFGRLESNKGIVADYKNEYAISTDMEEKCELMISIAELDKINSVDFFIEALADPEPDIRREAAIQMKSMVIHPDVLDALVIALDDKDDDVVIEVIEAVSGVNDNRVLVKLKQISTSHDDQLIRDVALDYAQKMESPE